MNEIIIYPDYLSPQELRLAAYYAALSNYRRLAAAFATELTGAGLADSTAVEAAGAELDRRRQESQPDRLKSIREVADLTGFSTSHLRLLAGQNRITGEKRFGKLWYLDLDEIRQMIDAEELVGPYKQK